MIADLPPPPPPIIHPIPVERPVVVVWGDAESMEKLRIRLESEGWQWATAILGEQTPALFLQAPESVSDERLETLLAEINSGRHGRLTAGYAPTYPPARP